MTCLHFSDLLKRKYLILEGKTPFLVTNCVLGNSLKKCGSIKTLMTACSFRSDFTSLVLNSNET